MIRKQFNQCRWACFALSLAGLAVLFVPAVRFTLSCFPAPNEDLRHGWLVLFFSGCAIWQVRRRLFANAAAPDWRGAVALLVCLGLLWIGVRGSQPRLWQIGLFGSVIALPFTFWGAGVARLLLFPAANLLFLLPLGFLEVLTVRLRLLSAWLATGLLNGAGFVVNQTGSTVAVSGQNAFTLDITEPHIWVMRSVFAFAAVAAGYAWLTQKTRLRQALLFASFVPLVILGDITRICSTVLVAKATGKDAHQFYEVSSGYLVLAVTLLLLVLAGIQLARVTPAARAEAVSPQAHPVTDGDLRGWRGVRALLPVLLALVLTAVFFVDLKQAPRPAPQMDPDTLIAADLPVQVAGCPGWRTWHCQGGTCGFTIGEEALPAAANGDAPACPACGQPLALRSLREKNILPQNPRILRRTYTRDDGRKFLVTVVVSRESRVSIHRPELCLPLQGSYIQSKEVQTLDLGNGRTVKANVMKIVRTGQGAMGLAYWFVNARMETPSHWTRIFSDVWQEAVHNRLNRWAMVTVFYTWEADETAQRRELGQFVGAWYPALIAQ
ncbi:MAG: exosortase/archaeosortase family protein [bacterium]